VFLPNHTLTKVGVPISPAGECAAKALRGDEHLCTRARVAAWLRFTWFRDQAAHCGDSAVTL
jgi:hypothetical protein